VLFEVDIINSLLWSHEGPLDRAYCTETGRNVVTPLRFKEKEIPPTEDKILVMILDKELRYPLVSQGLVQSL
jgi:hypothetical protein